MDLNSTLRRNRSTARSKRPLSSFQLPATLSRRLLVLCLSLIALAVGIAGGLPFLLVAAAITVTGFSLYTRQGTDRIINRVAASVGGSRNLFLLLSLVVGVSLVAHGAPGHAQLFDGARDAADSGIGTYIGTEESSSIIDILTFAMWALVVVGALAAIAGGVAQSVQVLVGGLTLFFGMAILIGVLEFADGLLFGA